MSLASTLKKHPILKPWDVEAFKSRFDSLSRGGDGLEQREAMKCIEEFAPGKTYDEIREAAKQVMSRPGILDFDEFVEAIALLREASGNAQKPKAQFEGITSQRAYEKRTLITSQQNISSAHTINEDEKEEFSNHINFALGGDNDIAHRLPINPKTMELFDECRDGLVLSKLINYSVPDTIDERVLNRGRKLSPFQITENNNVAINSAKAIGCSVVNIGSQDLAEGREHLILGLVWQIIKVGLFANIDIKLHPELYRLLEEDETLEDFLKLPADAILLRWFNYHLKNANWHRRVSNFSKDIKDSENYTVLLNQLVPAQCPRDPLNVNDLEQRAEMVLEYADRIGCRRYVSAKTILNGNPKLNLAFVALLFNTYPCLAPLETEEIEHAELDEFLFRDQYDREARAFALWLNSLNVDPFVNYLFEDIKDGQIILQAFDKIFPNTVNWRHVNAGRSLSRFKQIENTNLAVDLCKSQRFSLVGIQGADITDGTPTLVLALVWQLMRANIVQTLKSLNKGGREITDRDMVQWANTKASQSSSSINGGISSIRSFSDPSLASGHYLLGILDTLKHGIVDPSLVTRGASEDDMKMNAKYAISIARKLGATIFLLPEDIVEVKPKMILTFVGSLMAIEHA
ncbi:fimbrin [Mycoemilia scoparia]|uniref:Fimbrin n=1 Tax=Mycoemilia scoparia TaxID=417184 RepID=A0A9W8DQW7_9FUNG|nr:fimbrin [Mycoemilia scoparia]